MKEAAFSHARRTSDEPSLPNRLEPPRGEAQKRRKANFALTAFSEVRVSYRACGCLRDRPLQIGPFEVRSVQVGCGEIRAREVGMAQVCPR